MSGMRNGGGLLERYAPWILDGGAEGSYGYVVREDGALRYDGERPGYGWHAHGWFGKQQWRLWGGWPVLVDVFKRRWRLVGTNTTCHSRPPDDGLRTRFVPLIIMLRVLCVVDSPVGFHHREEVGEGLLEGCGSDRTVQRWMARSIENAMTMQQAIRLAIIEEIEPRPLESLFEGGLSPPDVVIHKRWASPVETITLWRGYAMLLVASRKLAVQASYLLAGARRRFATTKAALI
jgi:hypothetical protein